MLRLKIYSGKIMAGERFLLQPGVRIAEHALRTTSRSGSSAAVVHLENVPETEHDAAVTTVCAPLVKEVGVVHSPVGYSEVARVCRVVKLRAKLNPLILCDPCVLEDAEVQIVDAIGTQDVTARVTDALSGRNSLE